MDGLNVISDFSPQNFKHNVWAVKLQLLGKQYKTNCIVYNCATVILNHTHFSFLLLFLCLNVSPVFGMCSIMVDKIPTILQESTILMLNIELFSWKYSINAYIICFHFRFRYLVYFLFVLPIRHIDDL